jgi:hypothetical protein
MPRTLRPRLSLSRRAVAIAAAPLLLLGCASAGPRTDVGEDGEPPGASLCDAPAVDSTAYRRVERGAYSVGVPRGYVIAHTGARSHVDETEFRAGSRRIVLLQGNYPNLFADGQTQTILRSSCTAVIAGRPVEIVSISYNVESVELESPDQMTGVHFVVGARWHGAVGGRDVSMWVDTKSPDDSRRLRAMFWTMRFKGDSAAADGGR